MKFSPPPPRPEIADPALSRPLWTNGTPRDPQLLWLDKNENVDPELWALTHQLLAETAPEAVFTYPELAPLYHKLAQSTGLPADHLVLTAGSDGAIRAVFEAYIAPGDVVLHTTPTFAMYPVYARMYGAKVVLAQYQRNEVGPVLPVADLCAQIESTRPKLVCLPNPDSPTGTVFTSAEMETIITAAGNAGSLILIDEAYYPFHAETILPWVTRFPHLVVTRSTGKAWGLAGLRIGFAAAAPDVAILLHKVRPMYEVNTIAASLLERMLDHEPAMLASVDRIQDGKQAFLTAMASLGFPTWAGHGNFLHVDFGDKGEAVHSALAQVVLYRKAFAEPCLAGFSRFSAAPAPIMDKVASAIRNAVQGKT